MLNNSIFFMHCKAEKKKKRKCTNAFFKFNF